MKEIKFKVPSWSDFKYFIRLGVWPEDVKKAVNELIRKEKKRKNYHPRQIIPESGTQEPLDDLWKLIPYWSIIFQYKDGSMRSFITQTRLMHGDDFYAEIVDWFTDDESDKYFKYVYSTGFLTLIKSDIKYIEVKESDKK